MSMKDMEPVQNGYHCAQCEKTVVDFRNYSADEIQTYFKAKKGQHVCGILNQKPDEELPPVTITGDRLYRGVSRLFFAALLLAFAHLFVGCGGPTEATPPPTEYLMGAIAIPDVPLQKDTVIPNTPFRKTPLPRTVCRETSTPPDSTATITDPGLQSDEIESTDPVVLGNMVHSTMPEFPGGEVALMKYLQKNLRYPEYEREQGIQGKVYVSFTVAEDGTVEDIKIIRGVETAPNFNAEVIRVMQGMPKWKPGTREGKATRVKYNLPITFEPD